jgi:hypothetical protein
MRKATTFLPALALGVAAAVSGATSAFAGLITYTETASATGTLGGNAFTSVTLTMANVNTANIMNPSSGFFDITGPATVTVVESGGPVTATFSDIMQQVFSAQNAVLGSGTVGFHDATVNLDILDDSSSSFATYALNTAIGPITGASTISSHPSGYPTSSGAFILTSAGDATFTASVAVPAPPIGRGLSVLLAVCGVFAGARLLMRERRV